MVEHPPGGRLRLPPQSPPSAVPLPARGAVGDPDAHGEAFDIKESLAVLRRHLRLIATITVLAVAFTAYRIHRQRLRYQATAVIRLVDARRALAGNLDDASSMRSMAAPWIDPIESQLQVLRSRAVAAVVVDSQALGLRVQVAGFPARVLEDVSLAPDAPLDTVELRFGARALTVVADGRAQQAAYGTPVTVGGLRFTVTARPAGVAAGVLTVIPRTAAIDLVVGGLHARPRNRTDVVEVSYTAYDPAIAQRVVNTIVTVFQAANAERAQQQSRRRRLFVEAQLHQTDSLLRIAQDRLSEFRASRQLYGSDAVATAERNGLLELNVRRQELSADRQVYRSLLAELAQQGGEARQKTLRALVASPGLAGNPVVQAAYAQLVQHQAALDSLSAGRWGSAPSHPDVQRLHALIAGAERQLVDAVESQITSLDARIDALDELRARNAAALQRLPATQAAEARLVEQVESTRRMADQLRDEFQKARIAEAVEAGQVEVVDLARAPYAPIGTSRKTRLLTGFIVGLLLGTGAAFLAERLNTAIRRREEIESVLRVPGLAIIPQIGGNGAVHRLRARLRSLPRPGHRSAGSANGAGRMNGSALVTISDARSGSAEAFRTLRTNLIFAQAVQTLRRIVVTSPSPQDGKTTTAANLAVTFAQQGMRVLLVDCDLRRARVHTLFHVPREPGLTQLLLGHGAASEVIRPTMVEGLSILPAGTLPPNPSELLGGAAMRAALDALSADHDVVILDTPPVHAAADSTILGSLSDGVILVLRAGHTERLEAQDAIHRLGIAGVRVVGAVLNDPDHKVPQYGGGYYYYEYGG